MTDTRPPIIGELKTYVAKRNFTKTSEPSGARARSQPRSFIIVQKHAASRLHYDFRLELDGVLKSWAVPKGPSVDPKIRRLAVQVEDHPIDYANFEGVIPKGEYGGGTVMLWDAGTYKRVGGAASPAGMRDALAAGKLQFLLDGVRLQGIWTLIRTQLSSDDAPQWLLMHQRGLATMRIEEPTERFMSSVATGRTMEQIAKGG